MLTRVFLVMIAVLHAPVAHSQSAASGSATLSGPDAAAECPEIVAGVVNMPQIISEAGSAEAIYKMSQGQIAEYDKWFVQMEAASGQGVRTADIEALIKQGRENYDIELQVSEAALCYMNQ